MLGNKFYHASIRRYIILFGTLFNDIHIKRRNENDNVVLNYFGYHKSIFVAVLNFGEVYFFDKNFFLQDRIALMGAWRIFSEVWNDDENIFFALKYNKNTTKYLVYSLNSFSLSSYGYCFISFWP